MFNNDKRFDIDLAYGQVQEQLVAHMLSNAKIEVKSERDLWTRTNNIVIEFESRGKPSGIASTEADYWFHNLVKKDVILSTIVLEVKNLKEYIKKYNPPVVLGGDDKTSKLYLIKLSDLFNNLGNS